MLHSCLTDKRYVIKGMFYFVALCPLYTPLYQINMVHILNAGYKVVHICWQCTRQQIWTTLSAGKVFWKRTEDLTTECHFSIWGSSQLQ